MDQSKTIQRAANYASMLIGSVKLATILNLTYYIYALS